MYRTLKDAYEVTNDPRFLSGKTQIWYYKRSEALDFGMGSFGLERSGNWPSVDNLSLTHVFIGYVNESNPSKILGMMQGEYWSPDGEASTLPALRMAGHTSMSIGDIIVLPSGKTMMADMTGFYDLADAPVSPRMASMRTLTASDRSALIKLASSLPSGSPDRKAILAGLQVNAPITQSEFTKQMGLYGLTLFKKNRTMWQGFQGGKVGPYTTTNDVLQANQDTEDRVRKALIYLGATIKPLSGPKKGFLASFNQGPDAFSHAFFWDEVPNRLGNPEFKTYWLTVVPRKHP